MSKDYYKILGVPQNATKDEIKKKYRELAHKYHPDKSGGDESRFKEINEAYQILGDEKKRAQYDQFGTTFEETRRQGGFNWGGFGGGQGFDFGSEGGHSGGFGEFDFSDIFEDFFGGGAAGARTSSKREKRGKDIQIDLEMQFEESIFGGKRAVTLQKLSRCSSCGGSGGEKGTKIITCKTCNGRGSVQKTQRTFLGSFTQVSICQDCRGSGGRPEKLCHDCLGRGIKYDKETIEVVMPKSINDGEILKISGKGEASLSGGVPGDLYIRIRVAKHKTFRRQEDNIIMTLPINIAQSALGDTIEVATLDGNINLKIPEGTQGGDILKIRGRGAWSKSGYGRGDMLAEIKVEIPKKLSKKAKELLNELKKEI